MKNTELTPRLFFEEQKQMYTDKLLSVTKQIRQTSTWRIIAFLGTVLGVYLLSGVYLYALVLTGIIGSGVFIYLVARHGKLFKLKKWYRALAEINHTELALLKNDITGLPGGTEFIDDEHPYTSDLDIFGEGSLFQIIDRSATTKGRNALAGRLKHPLKNIEKIMQRQNAIKELQAKPIWRQHFQAYGKLNPDNDFIAEDFLRWAGEIKSVFNKPFYKIMLLVNPMLGLGVVFLIILGYIGFGSFLLFLLLPFFILAGKLAMINKTHQQVSRKEEVLQKYKLLFGLIEEESFASDMLRQNRNKITGSKNSAHLAMKKLSGITRSFDYRLNILVGLLLNVFFLWDIRQSIRLEKWKKEHSHQMEEAFKTLFLFDELSSLAGFAFNHPVAVFPEFTEEGFLLKAAQAQHPLIHPEKCVGNNIEIIGWNRFQIITGANMAGKSTYLRTVGVLMVLAMTGAPVTARKFKLSPVDLQTGIKTSDSLKDGESYFFAELKRLKNIVMRLEGGEKLFILLDEILRGTNSIDKHKGSESLLKKLLQLGASGMIATHDIALGELQKTFPEQIINRHFEVDMEEDELVFDYKIREGISRNTNASLLMKKMGITV